MTPKFRIDRADLRTLRVTGVHPTEDSTLYAESFSSDEGSFTYTESISLNALYLVTSNEEETLVEIQAVEHNSDLMEQCTFNIEKDGLYIVKHIVIPTDKWVEEYTSNSSYTNPYCYTYYYDTTNKVIMYKNTKTDKSFTSGFEKVYDSNVLFEVNLDSDIYSIYREDLYTFLMPDLQTCLYNVSNSLLEKLCPKNCNSLELSSETYNRDLLWMSLNVIKYQLDLGNYFKAQLLLEEVENCCSGICNSGKNLEGGSGCGCNKKS